MSIKQIVNTPELHDALMAELDILLEAERTALERAIDPIKMHQHQGAIRILRRLKVLREHVNERK